MRMTDAFEPCEILLVEDNPSDVELTMRALKKSNLANSIHVVGDGAEALEYLFGTGAYAGRDPGEHPRLVLLDLMLPKVSGLEVLEKMKQDRMTARIPVVVLTSSREERDLVESYDLGVNSYIVKPIEFDEFVKAVSELGLYWMVLNQPPD